MTNDLCCKAFITAWQEVGGCYTRAKSVVCISHPFILRTKGDGFMFFFFIGTKCLKGRWDKVKMRPARNSLRAYYGLMPKTVHILGANEWLNLFSGSATHPAPPHHPRPKQWHSPNQQSSGGCLTSSHQTPVRTRSAPPHPPSTHLPLNTISVTTYTNSCLNEESAAALERWGKK